MHAIPSGAENSTRRCDDCGSEVSDFAHADRCLAHDSAGYCLACGDELADDELERLICAWCAS